jgi:prepilin-type N-terminal cleavage/methylation domain-containing protein
MKRGFTLIELMISVTLGMMIVMLATAGFRVTSQAITSAQRMARTNEIIGIGVMAALEEADFWDSYDDRNDTTAGRTRQRLRQSMVLPAANVDGTTRLGLPFSPFNGRGIHTASWPSGSFGRGWKEDERLWAISADNELTWWTAHKAETQESDARFGHYSIFGVSRLPGREQVVIDPTADKGWHGGWMPRNGGSFYGTVDMSQPEIPDLPGNSSSTGLAAVRHTYPGWFFNQLRGLSNSLGWYGMFDYLPANAIVCYTMERSGRGNRMGSSTHMSDYGGRYVNCPADVTDTGGRPIFMVKTFSKKDAGWQFPDKPYFVLQSFSPNWAPHGIDFLTSYTAYGLIPPNGNQLEAAGGSLPLDQMCFYNRSVSRMESHDIPIGDWGANMSNDILEPRYPDAQEIAGPQVFSNFVNRTTAQTKLLEQKPTVWPEVSVSVARYLRLCRFSGQFKVSWTDPLSGEQAELRFTALGTTLRGARRMRGLDSLGGSP